LTKPSREPRKEESAECEHEGADDDADTVTVVGVPGEYLRVGVLVVRRVRDEQEADDECHCGEDACDRSPDVTTCLLHPALLDRW